MSRQACLARHTRAIVGGQYKASKYHRREGFEPQISTCGYCLSDRVSLFSIHNPLASDSQVLGRIAD